MQKLWHVSDSRKKIYVCIPIIRLRRILSLSPLFEEIHWSIPCNPTKANMWYNYWHYLYVYALPTTKSTAYILAYLCMCVHIHMRKIWYRTRFFLLRRSKNISYLSTKSNTWNSVHVRQVILEFRKSLVCRVLA